MSRVRADVVRAIAHAYGFDSGDFRALLEDLIGRFPDLTARELIDGLSQGMDALAAHWETVDGGAPRPAGRPHLTLVKK